MTEAGTTFVVFGSKCSARKKLLLFSSATLLFGSCGTSLYGQTIPSDPSAVPGGGTKSTLSQAAPPASATTPPSSNSTRASAADEIVVSAKRLGVSVQTIPAAVSVLSSQEIVKLGITNTQDLQTRVPGLLAGTNLGIPRVYIRGIGQESNTTGQEPGVATNVDGVYVGRAIQAYATEIDLDRVEVLRGPQGTLYGRNATAGTVNYYTKRATSDFQIGAKAGFGNMGSYDAGGFINGQITEGLNARFAIGYSNRDGDVKNLDDGKYLDSYKVGAVHGAINARPTSNLEFNLSLEAQKDDSNGPSFLNLTAPLAALLPGAVEGQDYVLSNGKWVTLEGPSGEKLYTKRASEAATLTTDWTPGGVRVRLITAYRHSLHRQMNADPTIFPIINTSVRIAAHQFSQELNVSGDVGPVDYVVGALYYHELAHESDFGVSKYPAPSLGGIGGINYDIRQTTDSYAGFGDVTVKVVKGVRLLAGLRYTHDAKTALQEDYFDFPFGRIDSCGVNAGTVEPAGTAPAQVGTSVGFNKLTGRVGAQADLGDHTMAYATVSRGYKAGGFSDFAGCGPTFKPESVDSYEIGLKGSAFDRRFTYRLAAFQMDYSNLQTQFATISGTSTVNAKSARIKGAEVELGAHLTDRFSVDANGSHLDAKYRDFLYTYQIGPMGLTPFQLDGYRMPEAPEWSGSIGGEYAQPLANGGSLTARVEGYFTTNYSFNPAAYNPNGNRADIQSGYSIGNAYLTYSSGENGRLTVRAFVKNFTNKFYLTSTLAYPILGNVVGFAALRRSFGVEVSTRF